MARFPVNSFLLTASCVFFLLSCSTRQDVHAGFRDEPQRSVVFDFEGKALPASDIELNNVVKAGGMYFCHFSERRRSSWGPNSSPDHLVSFSFNDRKLQWLPLPEDDGDLRTIFQRGDSLFAGVYERNTVDRYKYYCFDRKTGKWNPFDASASFIDGCYDGDEWAVSMWLMENSGQPCGLSQAHFQGVCVLGHEWGGSSDWRHLLCRR